MDGRHGCLQCPDGTVFEGRHYEGYGQFDGHDAYALAAEWNKPYLPEIFAGLEEPENGTDKMLVPLAIAWSSGDPEEFTVCLEMMAEKLPLIKDE